MVAQGHLTTQKSFYVEISRARDRAELVTDDAARLKEHLEQASGERISAPEGVEAAEPVPGTISGRAARDAEVTPDRGAAMESGPVVDMEIDADIPGERSPGRRERQAEIELEL